MSQCHRSNVNAETQEGMKKGEIQKQLLSFNLLIAGTAPKVWEGEKAVGLR